MKTFLALILYVGLVAFICLEMIYQVTVAPFDTITASPVELDSVSLYSVPVYDEHSPEAICMAENIYHEARNQPRDGQLLVGYVTVVRKNHVRYENTICGVVHEPSQFSWTLLSSVVDHDNPVEAAAWDVALEIAVHVLNTDVPLDMLAVTHYHTTKVAPEWSHNIPPHRVIGDHLIYTQILPQ